MAEVFTRTMYSTTFRLSEDGTKIRKYCCWVLTHVGGCVFAPDTKTTGWWLPYGWKVRGSKVREMERKGQADNLGGDPNLANQATQD